MTARRSDTILPTNPQTPEVPAMKTPNTKTETTPESPAAAPSSPPAATLDEPKEDPIDGVVREIRTALDAGDFRRAIAMCGNLPHVAPGERWTRPEVPVDLSGVPEKYRLKGGTK